MNFVSLLVYLADVLGTLNSLLNVAVVLALTPLVFGFWMWCTQDDGLADQQSWDAQMKEHQRYSSLYSAPKGNRPELKNVDPIGGYVKKPVAILLGVVLLSALVPNPNTVYAIAASQAAEKVLVSPTVNKAVNALNRWLDKQAK